METGAAAKTVIDVTLDTGVLDRRTIRRLKKAALGLPVRFAYTSPSDREAKGSTIKPRKTGVPKVLPEGLIVGESLVGQSIVWSDEDGERFERILQLMSHGAFPPPGGRGRLTRGQEHQLRDAIILSTHAQQGRDILITNERNAFGDPDPAAPRERQELRGALEDLCATRIMTAEAFRAHCAALRRSKDARLVVRCTTSAAAPAAALG